MANRFSFADTSGFQGYYNQLQARAAREEQERQRKKLEEQRRKASNHAGFGQALSTVASLGGAALGAGLTGGSMTGAMAGYSLGNAAAGGLMSLFPNIGGTEPSGDNPYYDKPSDLARLNSVVGAGLQGYGMIQQQMKQDAAQNFAGFTNTFIRNNPGSTEEEIYTALKGKDSPYEEAKGLFGESLLNDQSLRQVARDAFQRKADMALTLYNQALQLPDVAQKKNVVQNWHNTFGKAHSDLIMPGSNEAIQAAISQNLSAQEAANVLHAWIQEQGGDPLKTIELNADLTNYVKNKAANGPGFESYISTAKPFIKTFHELNPAAQTAVLAAIQDTTKQQNLALQKSIGTAAAEDRKNAYNELTSFADGIVREYDSIRYATSEEFDKEYLKDSAYDTLYEFDENGNRSERIKPILTEEAFLTIAYAQRPGQDELIVKALVHKFPNTKRVKDAYTNLDKADVYASLVAKKVITEGEQGDVARDVARNNTATSRESSTTPEATPLPPAAESTDASTLQSEVKPREDLQKGLREELAGYSSTFVSPNSEEIKRLEQIIANDSVPYARKEEANQKLQKLQSSDEQAKIRQRYETNIYGPLREAATSVTEAVVDRLTPNPEPEVSPDAIADLENRTVEELKELQVTVNSRLQTLLKDNTYTSGPVTYLNPDPEVKAGITRLQKFSAAIQKTIEAKETPSVTKRKLSYEEDPNFIRPNDDTDQALREGGLSAYITTLASEYEPKEDVLKNPKPRPTTTSMGSAPVVEMTFTGDSINPQTSMGTGATAVVRGDVRRDNRMKGEGRLRPTPSGGYRFAQPDAPIGTGIAKPSQFSSQQTPRYMSEEAYADPSRSFDVPINTAPTDPINRDAQRIQVPRPQPRIDGVPEAQEVLQEREAARLEFLQSIADNPKYSRYRAEPKKIEEIIVEAAEQADLPAEEAALVLALESDFGKTSENISQIKGAALKDVEKKLGRKLDPKDPEDNILAGVTYFKMIKKAGDSFREGYTRFIFGPTGGEKVLKAKDNELISEVISKTAYDNNSGWLSFNGQSLTVKQVRDKLEQRIETKTQEVASLGFAVATSVPEPEMGIPTAPSYRGESSGLASVYQTQLDQGPTEAATPTYMNDRPLTSMGVTNNRTNIEYSVGGQTTTSRQEAERLVRMQEQKANATRQAQNAALREAEERKYQADRKTTVFQQIRGGDIIRLEEEINTLLAQPWMNQTGLLAQKAELASASRIIDAYRRKKNPTTADEQKLEFAIRSYQRVMSFLQSLQGK